MITIEDKIIDFFNNDNRLLKLIGFNNEKHYNYLMKKIYKQSLECSNCKIYDKGFELPTNMSAIALVQQSVKTMNLNNLANEDIVLTNNSELNITVKKAIVDIIQPLLLTTNFQNQTIKNNFLIKHIVWLYERLNEFEWSNNLKPILIIYGELELDELYHLQLLNYIGAKIIYINSSRNIVLNNLSKIEEDTISLETVAPIESFGVRVSLGVDELNLPKETNNTNDDKVVKTWAKQAKDELHKGLYENSGVFVPWQFKSGSTKPLCIDAVIEDIETYWTQESRFRPGFKVENTTVYVPNFITKINGTYTDITKYKKLVDFTKGAKLTLFKEGVDITPKVYTDEDMYSLMFMIENNEVNYEKIKTHKLYKLNNINLDVQNFIIRKINDFILDYKDIVDMKYILDVIATVITMSEEYVKLIECFDFPFKIPKLIIYISDRSNFDTRTGLFLNYINSIGIDIIVYSPTGSLSIEEHRYNNPLSIITLDEMNFDLNYSKLTLIKIKEKTSIFKKLFNF